MSESGGMEVIMTAPYIQKILRMTEPAIKAQVLMHSSSADFNYMINESL
jgi:hypothetical protein